MSKKVLGRGLDALIPKSGRSSDKTGALEGERLVQLPVDSIKTNPQQPRKRFDDEKIKSLSESIGQDGVLQPVVVRRRGERYELIMGERRLQAARLAGVPTIPALVRSAEEADALRLALVENLQRENLNPIEVGEAYRRLIDTYDISQSRLAELVGKDRSSVANTLRLLSLPEEIRQLIVDGRLSEGHARALLALSTRSAQLSLAERIVKDRLTVRQAERESGADRKRSKAPKQAKEKPTHIKFLEDALASHLGTRVHVEEQRGGRGRLVIEFYSHEEFERLASLMRIPLPR